MSPGPLRIGRRLLERTPIFKYVVAYFIRMLFRRYGFGASYEAYEDLFPDPEETLVIARSGTSRALRITLRGHPYSRSNKAATLNIDPVILDGIEYRLNKNLDTEGHYLKKTEPQEVNIEDVFERASDLHQKVVAATAGHDEAMKRSREVEKLARTYLDKHPA